MATYETVLVHTIGHSDHDIAALASLVRRHSVGLVVDVRSHPYSKWAPQYNQEGLARYLQNAGIEYLYMGDVLGGRPSDLSLYGEGSELPDYERLAATKYYQAGLVQLMDLARTRRTAIMCSEGDHVQCHRHLLIAQSLLSNGIRVCHIQRDGTALEGVLLPRQLSLFG